MKLTLIRIALGLALSLSLVSHLKSEEGGSGHYLPGGAASFIDALPGRPSLAVFDFFAIYTGSAEGSRQLPLGGVITAGLDATAYANTIGAFYESGFTPFGGNYAVGIGIPYVWMEAEARVGSLKVRDTANGVGDILLYPFIIGWTNGTDLKYDVRLGIYAPSGEYDAGALANVGKNYWTFEPTLSLSYISSKIGLEVSAFAAMDFSTRNDDTDYQTGDRFHLDLTVAEHLPLLGGFVGVGASGFYYQQVSGDSGSGATLGDFEGRTVGVGPVISYIRKLGKTDFAAEIKWLPELDVEHRTQGDYIWVKVGMVF